MRKNQYESNDEVENLDDQFQTSEEDDLLSNETNFDEEMSESLTPTDDEFMQDHDEPKEVYFQGVSYIGWISLIISFIALFAMPVLFGTVGIILGFVARNRDAEWLGNIAIVLGIIAIISAMFIRPFF
ncbi:MAG TPA: DUF4190 domain-containing protein [Bacillota bacterium]|nr:DUF4190 domain-containing protein [Bacillota bacterium]